MYLFLADLVVVIHFIFIIFVLFGALLEMKWLWVIWVHIPAIVWGISIEVFGWVCPLTPLEQWLRAQAGSVTYDLSFIEKYLVPIIYPSILTRELQYVLAFIVILINIVIYGYLWKVRVK